MNHKDLFFKHHLAQTTPFPIGIEIERAEGIWLYSPGGKKWIDLISGVGVSSIGHGNRRVIEAIKAQAERHLHVMVYGEYLQSEQSKAASLLTAMLPPELDTVYFVNSGAEAVEAALKLGKRVTGRSKLISCRGAYHGSTHGAMSVSGNEVKKQRFRPLLTDVHFMQFNDLNSLDLIDAATACVIIETVQGDAGVRVPDRLWLESLRRRCTEMGVLLIFDEIQAGMGRTGKNFAFEHFGVVPDVLVLGKALGGGLPIGALVSNRKHMEQFTEDPMLGHITTFGGHPLVCAAAAAGIEVLNTEIDYQRVQKIGERMAKAFRDHPRVKEVRQIGYFFAIDLETEEHVKHVVEYGLDHGFIGFWFLSCPWSFRIAPPLTMTEEESHLATQLIIAALDALS